MISVFVSQKANAQRNYLSEGIKIANPEWAQHEAQLFKPLNLTNTRFIKLQKRSHNPIKRPRIKINEKFLRYRIALNVNIIATLSGRDIFNNNFWHP